jgi:hypothetical protein
MYLCILFLVFPSVNQRVTFFFNVVCMSLYLNWAFLFVLYYSIYLNVYIYFVMIKFQKVEQYHQRNRFWLDRYIQINKYNMLSNPGPSSQSISISSASSISDPLLDEFDECITQFTSFMHLNVQSLVPKIDLLNVELQTTLTRWKNI